jgi:hypothetical protein
MSRFYLDLFGNTPAFIGAGVGWKEWFHGRSGVAVSQESGGDAAACFCDNGTDVPTIRFYTTKSHSTQPVHPSDYQIRSLVCLLLLRFRAHNSGTTSWNLGNTLDKESALNGRR